MRRAEIALDMLRDRESGYPLSVRAIGAIRWLLPKRLRSGRLNQALRIFQKWRNHL